MYTFKDAMVNEVLACSQRCNLKSDAKTMIFFFARYLWLMRQMNVLVNVAYFIFHHGLQCNRNTVVVYFLCAFTASSHSQRVAKEIYYYSTEL